MRQELAEVLVRTGQGTPMGRVMRRYWVPVMLASEIAEPDCPPVRVQLLGEQLVAFRDTRDVRGWSTSSARIAAHRSSSGATRRAGYAALSRLEIRMPANAWT